MTRRTTGNLMIFTSTQTKSKTPFVYNPKALVIEPTKHNKIEKIPKKKNISIIIR